MKIPKGIKVSDLRVGTGAVAASGTFALIDYDCYLPRGERCDTSRNRPSPVQMEVGKRMTLPAFAYGEGAPRSEYHVLRARQGLRPAPKRRPALRNRIASHCRSLGQSRLRVACEIGFDVTHNYGVQRTGAAHSYRTGQVGRALRGPDR